MHVALIHPAFAAFHDRLNSLDDATNADDLLFARELCFAMSEIYDFESMREQEFVRLFGCYLGQAMGVGLAMHRDSDGCIITANGLALNIKITNELGSGGCCPYTQCVASYAKICRDKAKTGTVCLPLPCFGLVVAGPLIGIVGMAFDGNNVLCDPLSDFLPAMDLVNDRANYLKIARHFSALRNAVVSLFDWYSSQRACMPLKQAVHPYLCAIDVFRWTYIERMVAGQNVYRVRLHTDPECLAIVKFAQQYSIEAHGFCADLKVAPKIYAQTTLAHGWQCIVMEYIEAVPWSLKLPPEVHLSYVSLVKAAVGKMHENGLVHGDLRTNNILWRRDSGGAVVVWLVDFDFAGRDGEATYPPDLNLTINWHGEVKAFCKVRKEHDLYMIDRVRTSSNSISILIRE